MAGTDELMARLSQLEQGYYGDKEAARQKQFMDTYGSRFSGNHSLGMAILNELDARGIDTSAADEAVQQILDTLRTDCQSILDMLNNVQEAAIQNAQKVETIANAVGGAVAANPEAAGPDATPPEVEPAEVPPVLDTLDPNSLSAGPSEEQLAAMDADDEGGEEQPPAEEPPAEQPPAEEPPAEQLPPDQTVSDIRTKRIEKMKARWGKTGAQKKKEKESSETKETKPVKAVVSDENLKNVFRPSVGMIAAAQRGF